VKRVDARELARNAQRDVAHGHDPVAEKRAARDVLIFGELADQYIDVHAKPDKKRLFAAPMAPVFVIAGAVVGASIMAVTPTIILARHAR